MYKDDEKDVNIFVQIKGGYMMTRSEIHDVMNVNISCVAKEVDYGVR